jgi:hypothetical protein
MVFDFGLFFLLPHRQRGSKWVRSNSTIILVFKGIQEDGKMYVPLTRCLQIKADVPYLRLIIVFWNIQPGSKTNQNFRQFIIWNMKIFRIWIFIWWTGISEGFPRFRLEKRKGRWVDRIRRKCVNNLIRHRQTTWKFLNLLLELNLWWEMKFQ